MRKIIFFFISILTFSVSYSQFYDEKIADAMNSGDWIALDSVYDEAPKDSIWDFLEVYSRCLIGNRLNRPEVSIPAFAELLQNHSEELDLGNLFSSSLMYAIDLSKVGKNKEAAELLTSILDATKQYLDSANVAVIQNQLDLYTALSNYNPYALSFQGEMATIPFSIINSEKNKGSRLKLDDCSINGMDADITFDTGAALNVISQEMADRLQLTPLDASVIAGGINDVDGKYVLAKEIRFGDLTATDVPFVILPLETGNEEADKFLHQYGIIIGTPFMLQIKDFTIDFINNEITIPAIAPERTSQKPNMFFGDGLTFSAKGKVLNEPMIMHIDTGNADYADLGSQFYVNNKEFVETHGKLESVGRAGAGGVHKSEAYLVSDIPVELGGNTVVPAEIIVAKEDLSDISALRFDCNIGLKTLMMFGKVRFNLIDFVISTEQRQEDSLPQNVIRKRKASMILSEFVKLENNQYQLEISKNEAEKLGVSPELYDEIVADLSNTNMWILKAIENGDTIEIPNIQVLAKEHKHRMRKAYTILSEFVKLEDYKYRLEISKSEAQKLGVDSELYEEIMQDLSFTNSSILKSLENGDSVEIPDIKAIAKMYEKQEF